jgi:hypothetical protein
LLSLFLGVLEGARSSDDTGGTEHPIDLPKAAE